MSSKAILLAHCPDKKGIVTAVTEFIYQHNGNITYLDQHVDSAKNIFFMRMEWSLDEFDLARNEIQSAFDQKIATPFNMVWSLDFSDLIPKMALFVSKQSHCLYDVLSRWKSGELEVNIPLVIGNHPEAEDIAKRFEVEFHLFKIDKNNKSEQEKKQLQLLKQKEVDFIVLARYMQIVSPEFISHYPNRIINIHHSFLPAFPGAKPYHSAHERGVKVIGATSHYVTEELDAGPIIEQDVEHIDHTESIEDLIRKGKDLERIVLSRAIWYHLQRKVLVYENRTAVFN